VQLREIQKAWGNNVHRKKEGKFCEILSAMRGVRSTLLNLEGKDSAVN